MIGNGSILIYQTADGLIKIETRLENETVWLTLEQMSELFQKSKSTINEHVLNIFKEEELDEKVSCRNFRHDTQHGAMRGEVENFLHKFIQS
jgi:hypothetical protein